MVRISKEFFFFEVERFEKQKIYYRKSRRTGCDLGEYKTIIKYCDLLKLTGFFCFVKYSNFMAFLLLLFFVCHRRHREEELFLFPWIFIWRLMVKSIDGNGHQVQWVFQHQLNFDSPTCFVFPSAPKSNDFDYNTAEHDLFRLYEDATSRNKTNKNIC